MTLVIASRTKKEVSFSSDSRIIFGSDGHFDKGIKIFNVPFKLKGLAKSREELDFKRYEFELEYGIAVVGSSINAYTVKDSIVEILPNITYVTNLSDISIIGIGSLVYDIYKEVSKELTPILRKNGFCEILMGGYCLERRKIRILRFYPEVSNTETKYFYEEVLPNEGMMFFGSGKKIAERFYEENNLLEPLQILKKVINSREDKAVGGAMQYGAFYTENFKISGVIEKELDGEGNLINSVKYRRGYIIEDETSKLINPPHLFVSYTYKPMEHSNHVIENHNTKDEGTDNSNNPKESNEGETNGSYPFEIGYYENLFEEETGEKVWIAKYHGEHKEKRYYVNENFAEWAKKHENVRLKLWK